MGKTRLGLLWLGLSMVMVAGGKNDSDAVEQEEILTIRVAALGNPDSPEGLGYKFFKQDLEQRSQAAIKVKLFLSGQLGDFKSVINELRSGDLEISQSGPPSWIIPEAEILGAPYLIKNHSHFLRVMEESEYGRGIVKQLEDKGLKVIAYMSSGTRVTSANRPINSIEDMAGLKIRVPQNDFLLAFARYTGANPTPIAFQEVYLALQTNQVDAQENPLGTIKSMKFYEVQNSIALTNHYSGLGMLHYSLALWNKLSAAQQQLILASGDAFARETYKFFEADAASFEKFFIDQGLTVTRPDLEPFRAAMRPYYDKLSAKFNTDAIQQIQALAE